MEIDQTMPEEVPDTLSEFDICLQLRNAGFPQKRRYGAMYYVRPDMLINISDLSVLKGDGYTDFENIFNTLVFKPSLDDLEYESRDFFDQIRWTNRSGVFAYSNIQTIEPDASNPDTYIRVGSKTEWKARAKLYVQVKIFKNGPPRTINPEDLFKSENQEIGAEPKI